MSVDVMVNGRPWKVALESAEQPGRFTVTIKGKRRKVDASWIDAETLSLVDLGDGGRAYEVRLHARGDNGAIGVEVGGTLYEASVAKRGRVPFSEPVAGKMAPDPVSIKSPMPGRVVRVLGAVGDRVAARQGIVVVEAMKMENELRTPRDGTIREILVAPGAAVETGAVLVVIAD